MAEVNSQGSSSSTLDYLDMTSAGLEGYRKREHEDDADEIKPKKQKSSVDDDWMDDGDLFTKVVKSNSQDAAASSSSVLDTVSMSETGNNEQSVIQLNGKTDATDNVETLGENATKVCNGNQESKQTVTKTDSIHEDAQTIADLLEIKNVEAIRSRLRKVRKNPDRIEIVTNQLLEESEEDICEIIDVKEREEDGCEIVGVVRPSDKPSSSKNEKKENSDRDNVMQKMLKDIKEVCTRLKQSNPAAKFDTNTAYLLLESNLNKKNRVDIVVREMLETDSMESTAVENRQTQTLSLKEKSGDDSLEIIEDVVEEDRSSKDTTVAKDGTSEDVSDAEIDILEEVQIVMKKYPKADANRVFALLECRKNHKDRLKTVIGILKDRESDADEKSDNSKPEVKRVLSESAVADDPLYRDMLQIAKIFPHIDKNEIYALCEVHHDKSRRIELVTEELLKAKRGSDDNDDSQSVSSQLPEATIPNKCSPKLKSAKTDEMTMNENVAEGSGTSENYVSPLDELTDNVEHMKAIFPDCDPDYLYYMLEQRFADPNRVQNLSAEMFEHRNYPRLKERLEKEKKAANFRRIKKMEFKMEEFLQLFPNALTDFYDETKTVMDSYKEHALVHMKNEFPEMHATYIQQVFTAHQSHLTPALRQLQLEAVELTLPDTQSGRRRRRPRGHQQKFRKTPRPTEMTMPDVPDEYFYKELMFTKHEQEIKDHVKEQEDEKKRRLEEAKEAGELYECTCCYDDEVLFEDMSTCPDGHLFCNECVRRSAESAIGEGKVKFLCFEEKCELEFPKNALQKVLSSKLFSTLLRKIQEEEIRQADIPDLVSCPYCSFATIIPEDDANKVFRCMNPECLKESCRLCKEPNHIPLRCNEVEKQGETDMRTFIENKITEAMIRTCWKCKKRFFKTEGCNMMTCPCGAQMCYVCQKPNIDYSHFGEKGCPGDTDVRKLHLKEMEKAGQLARKKYEDDHPEMYGQNLKYDPFNVLKQAKKAKTRGNWVVGAGAGAGADFYEDEGDYDYDDESSEGGFGVENDSSDDDGGAAAGWRFW